MRIELASLEGAKGEFAHAYAPDELDLQDEWVSLRVPPAVSGQIRRDGARLKVNGKVSAQLQLECARCLKQIEFPIDSAFKFEYVTREDYEAQQAIELTEDELDLSVFDGQVIDLDELVREELLLAVPAHLLCQEGCKGVCPNCGVDRNSTECRCGDGETDPRWAGLKDLVNSE